MLTNKKLSIFETFVADLSLPKYTNGQKVEITPSVQNLNGSFIMSGTNSATTVSAFGNGSGSIWMNNAPQSDDDIEERNRMWNIPQPNVREVKKGFFERLFSKSEEKKNVEESKKKTMTIVKFFTMLASNLQELSTLTDIAVHYETMITNAQVAGQTALVETLKSRLEAAKTETILVNAKLTQYLTEQQIIDFYHATSKDKALKLTWIKNFVKPIPSDILKLKQELDAKFTFDNYVVLHYDPKGDATNLTVQEKKDIEERKKDPILFGVIQHSRRLYYIGDWQDEYCNLTLDTVIETLGDNVGNINAETVKTYIDRGYDKETRFKKEEQLAEEVADTRGKARKAVDNFIDNLTPKVSKKRK